MSFMLWQREAPGAIATDRRVLSAQEVPVLEQANALCDRLNQMVCAQPDKTQAATQAAHDQGYQQGLQAGQQAASDQLADALTSMSRQLAESQEQMRTELSTLALAVVKKLMGQYANDETLAGLAVTAANQAMQQSHESPALTLHVHPDQAADVRKRLAQWAGSDEAAQLSVQADPDCAPNDCRLNSELGTIDASLSTQLARLSQAWGSHNPDPATE